MRILVCLLLCVYAVAADSGYADVTYGGYLDLKTPYKGCHYVGQYLKHPSDECKFLRCDYGNEPWKDQYGKIQLFAREMRCANGLSVGYEYSKGYDNPCNTPNKKCFVHPKKTHSYHEVDTKAVYDSYNDHSNDGYGKKQSYDTHTSYDNQNSYDTHNKGYDTHNKGYDTHNKGYDTRNKGYDTHNTGYDTHNTGYDTHNKGYDTHDSYDTHSQGYDKHDQKPHQVYDTKHSGYDNQKNTYDNKKTVYTQHAYNVHDTKHSGYGKHEKKDY